MIEGPCSLLLKSSASGVKTGNACLGQVMKQTIIET